MVVYDNDGHESPLTHVKSKKLDPSLVPRVRPEDLKDRTKYQPYDFVRVSFPLVRLSAEDMVKELDLDYLAAS